MKLTITSKLLRAGLLLCPLFFTAACKKDPVFRYTAKPEIKISAGDTRLQGNLIHFYSDTVYILTTNINIAAGQDFLIDAGTLVKANPQVRVTVTAGGKITAAGTAEQPIVFTLNAPKGSQISQFTGPWNGILVNGSAASSGILNYVRIEFAGGLNAASSALALNNVGKLTSVNNIQVSHSVSNSFEFNGGDFSGHNFLSLYSTGTDFNLINGYTGNLQNLLAYKHPVFANTRPSLAGVNIEGATTKPALSNLTVLGPSFKQGKDINGYSAGLPNRRGALITGNNCQFNIRNSVFIGFPVRTPLNDIDTADLRTYHLNSFASAAALDSGRSSITYSFFHEGGSSAFYLQPNSYPPYNSGNLREFLLRTKYHNEVITSAEQLNLIDPYNYFNGIPDPFPAAGSKLLTGADFNDSLGIFKNTFFKPVTYRGALGTENWMKGWTNFIPLRTDYNY